MDYESSVGFAIKITGKSLTGTTAGTLKRLRAKQDDHKEGYEA